jgi:hypothetical protein
MMNVDLFSLLDKFLGELVHNSKFMGPEDVLFMYDFKQQLPVHPGGNQSDIISAIIVSSASWSLMQKFQLVQNMGGQKFLAENVTPGHVI